MTESSASSRLLLLDMASTFLFLAVFLLTGSIALSVGLGMALGVAQVGWEFARRKPVDVMQWMSFFIVLASGMVAQSPPIRACHAQAYNHLLRGRRRDAEAGVDEPIPAARRCGMGSGYRHHLWLCVGRAHVPLGGVEPYRRDEFQRHGLVGVHVGLGCRQQGRLVPDLIRNHALRRHAPPSGADVASPSPACGRSASRLDPAHEQQDQTRREAGDRENVGCQQRYVLPPEDARETCA